jgi:hypothetical protein
LILIQEMILPSRAACLATPTSEKETGSRYARYLLPVPFNPDIPLGGAKLLHEPCRTYSGILPPGFLTNSPAIASSTGRQATWNMPRQHLVP